MKVRTVSIVKNEQRDLYHLRQRTQYQHSIKNIRRLRPNAVSRQSHRAPGNTIVAAPTETRRRCLRRTQEHQIHRQNAERRNNDNHLAARPAAAAPGSLRSFIASRPFRSPSNSGERKAGTITRKSNCG